MTNVLLASIGLNFLLVLIIMYLDARHYNERSDLYNRIMAGSLPEYKVTTQKNASKRPGQKSNFLYQSIQQAKNQEED